MTAIGESHPSMPEDALKEKHVILTGQVLEEHSHKKLRRQEQSHSPDQKNMTSQEDSSPITKGLLLPFTQLSLTFNNIKYSIDMPEVFLFLSLMNTKLHLPLHYTRSFIELYGSTLTGNGSTRSVGRPLVAFEGCQWFV